MINYLVNALLQPKYSLIGSIPPRSTPFHTNCNPYILSEQYISKDMVNIRLNAPKKPNDKKCKKLHIKYHSKIIRHIKKKLNAHVISSIDVQKVNNAILKRYETSVYSEYTMRYSNVLYALLINFIYLIYINIAMDQLSKNITDAIELEKQVLQNSMALIKDTIINTTQEMIKAIGDIRPAQNYGLPQSMNISKILIKENSSNMQIETEGSDKENLKKEIAKEMDTIKENFWTTKFLNPNTYCKKCQQLKHKDSNCKFICNMCNGAHQANICTHKLHCKWCGQKKGEHKCEAFEHIYRTKIKCPICKLKGHFGKECNLLFLALSTNWRKNNNMIKKRRRFRTRLGVNFRRNNRRIAVRNK